MAARAGLLLLGISLLLFTEVIRLAAPTGVRANGSRRSEGLLEAGAGGARPGINNSKAPSPLGLEVRPRGELVLHRKSIKLVCTGSASQGANVTWLYNGRACEPNHNHCNGQFLRKGALRVKKKSGGNPRQNEYRCLVNTSDGARLRSAPTNILYAELSDAFEESPEDLVVRQGEVARFSCFIDSVPFPPNITWLRDGNVLPDDKTKYVFLPPGVLYINATNASDAGSYRCVAANEYVNVTQKSKEAKLTVVVPGQETGDSSPVSLYPQASYSHAPLNGTNLRLACAASGYPSPTVFWTFVPRGSESKLSPRKAFRRWSTGLAVLELNNLNALHTGLYVCSTKGSANEFLVQNVTVQVLIPPTFIKKPTNQVCPNGRTARFECQAQGTPTPDIYWLRNAENITINGRRTVYVKEFNKLELAISATVPTDSGIYQCVAVNAAGEIWAAGRLQVNASRDSPAAPTSLKCEARSPVKMFISWEPPKLLPSTNITAYTVHYRPVEEGKEEVSPPEPGNSTSVEVTKLLEPFTNYTFYVRLWNNHGASDQSATITCSTDESVPNAAPKISVNVINSTKLNLMWKPLTKKEAQGIVTEYKLEWRLFQDPLVNIKSLPTDVEQYVLTGLTPGKQYDVRILARTKEGWPNISEAQLGWLTVMMPSSNDLSQIQISILNSTSVKAKWNIKPNSVLQFTSCKIICKSEDGATVASVNLTQDSTEYIFSNLEPNVYSFESCALHREETLHCTTKNVDLKKISISNVPTALEAVPLSSNSISLTWISRKSAESNSFEVCYHQVLLSNKTFTCIPVNSTKIIISNLKPFMLYQFKVRSLDGSTDDNSFSEPVECYTNEDVPGKVKNIEFSKANDTVSLVWKEPSDMNGIIQNYFVAYSSDSLEPRSAWKNITVFGNRTSTNLSGLVPGKQYFVVIQAATKAGSGNPTEPLVILIKESSSEVQSSLDKEKSLWTPAEPKLKGIVLGSCIGAICIIACIIYVLHKRKQSRLQSLHESAQPLKTRVLEHNGNGNCYIDRSPAPNCHTGGLNDFELSVPYPSMSNNPTCDSKGALVNGLIESCAKEPLLAPWEVNGFRKDLRITENPQYKPRENEDSKKSAQSDHDELPEPNSMQLTNLDYDLGGSDESMNNNMCRRPVTDGTHEALPRKAAPKIVPVLEPNG
ncbi:protogenin-like [Copidosoma floridanum]|uniref:protogenin-like n=1 Tax=Copidosoma floridanum TaxID=29053 RepID=UPI0006C9B4AC|nr:protogenin-like [Copidosoma floridanum]